jgi:hypothetical protein
MFDAFMPLQILLCDVVLLYFIIANWIHSNFKFVLNSNKFLQTKNVLVIKEKGLFNFSLAEALLHRPNLHLCPSPRMAQAAQ